MTKFQRKVLEMTSNIPLGRVTTYKRIAEAVGHPKAYRAVGNALGNNPHPGVIPCHRVIKSDGSIGGFGLGVDKKIEMLEDEGVVIEDDKINLDKYLAKNLSSKK